MKKFVFSIILSIFTLISFGQKPVELSDDSFTTKVFDYENQTQWSYNGELPAIVDFYADWCGPCKKLAPILSDLAKEYKGKIIVYKVNTQHARKVASAFGISSIPTLLFIPKTGTPSKSVGFMSKQDIKKAIKDVLKIN